MPDVLGPVPGAAQLEFVRRLGLRSAGTADSRSFERVAEAALWRSPPARGLPRRPLSGAGVRPRTGAAPIDPADVSTEELVRVGVGVLAELLVHGAQPADPRLDALDPPRRPSPAPRRRLTRQFRLAGAPVTTSAVRARLVAAGHVGGGRRPDVVILVQPLDRQLHEVWSARVQAGATVRWPTFVTRWARRDALPPAADVERIAAHWARRVGPQKIHVVVAPEGAEHACRAAAVALGLRAASSGPAPEVLDLSAAALDVLRRLNRVLAVRVVEDRHRRLLPRVTSLLVADHGPAHAVPSARPAGLAAPPAHVAWLRARAARQAGVIADAGYAVHGELGRIVPDGAPGRTEPRRKAVLDRVLDLCPALAAQNDPTGAEGRST